MPQLIGGLPLSSLLSLLLVPYTFELDNEFERHMSGIRREDGRRPSKVSLVMWENFLRYADGSDLPVAQLPDLAGISDDLHPYLTMERWGYVTVGAPDLADPDARPHRRDRVVRPTSVGLRACDVWRPLAASIDERWIARFGEGPIGELRRCLETVAAGIGFDLPRYLPVVGYGMATPAGRRRVPGAEASDGSSGADVFLPQLGLPLSTLLSLVLYEWILEFERESEVSLPVSANALRLLADAGKDGALSRELPAAAGISAETMNLMLAFLARHNYATLGAVPSGRSGNRFGKVVCLTPRGWEAHARYVEILTAIEERWTARFGSVIGDLREAFLELTTQKSGTSWRLAQSLVPPPGGWRGDRNHLHQTELVVADPLYRLPHCPVVTHRGGWPDGS